MAGKLGKLSVIHQTKTILTITTFWMMIYSFICQMIEKKLEPTFEFWLIFNICTASTIHTAI